MNKDMQAVGGELAKLLMGLVRGEKINESSLTLEDFEAILFGPELDLGGLKTLLTNLDLYGCQHKVIAQCGLCVYAFRVLYKQGLEDERDYTAMLKVIESVTTAISVYEFAETFSDIENVVKKQEGLTPAGTAEKIFSHVSLNQQLSAI